MNDAKQDIMQPQYGTREWLVSEVYRLRDINKDLLEALCNLVETARAFGGYHTSAYLNRDAYLHKSWEAMMESIARGRELVAKAEGK